MGNAIISRGIDVSKKADINHKHSSADITSGTLPINRGGTGATSASDALSSLGGVPETRTINSKALNSDIELNSTDVGAASYEVKTGADFNEMKTPGLYTMQSCTTNAPSSGSYHSLIVNKSDTGNYVQQIAIKESTYEIYVRYLNGSSWSVWEQISMSDHVQPVDKGGTGATSASDALLNLGLTATATELNYTNGVTSNIQMQIDTMKSNFQDGCEKIASAITAEGISTADNSSPEEMALNISEIRSGGNATAGNILSGKTAYSGKSYITGTMINQGAKTLTPEGNYTVTFGEGYYSSVTADGTAAYEAGRNSKKLIRKELNFTYDQGYVTDIEGYKTFTVDNFAICECKLTLQTWANGTPTAKTTTVDGSSLSYNANDGSIMCTYCQPKHYISGSTQKMAAEASLDIKMVVYYVG